MPNKDSAKKALRQNAVHAARNLKRRTAFKDALKKTLKAPSKKEAMEMVKTAQQALDKAARTGVIKRNTAARKLSRLMKKVQTMAK